MEINRCLFLKTIIKLSITSLGDIYGGSKKVRFNHNTVSLKVSTDLLVVFATGS